MKPFMHIALFFHCQHLALYCIAAGKSGENHTLNWLWLSWHHLVDCITSWSYTSETPILPFNNLLLKEQHCNTCIWANNDFLSSDFLSSLNFGLVTDIQNTMHMSPPCIRTGGLKKTAKTLFTNMEWPGDLSPCFAGTLILGPSGGLLLRNALRARINL